MDRGFYGLLCGTLCVLQGKASAKQLGEAMGAWRSDGKTSPFDLLAQQVHLSMEDRSRLLEEINRSLDESAVVLAHRLRSSANDPEIDRLWADIQLAPRPPTDGAESRYHLGAILGIGSNGQVRIAHDNRLDRDVAFKELRQEHRKDTQRRRSFIKEARITSKLDHPAVVPIYDVGATSSPYYAMKLIRGKTLGDIIDQYWERRRTKADDPLELHGLLRTFLKACDAVGFAHSKGVVHRDLKPANIVVEGFGEVFVIDWGLALEQNNSPRDVGAKGVLPLGASSPPPACVIGSPGYMSPEQAAGKSEAVDGRSDIYALGAILYRILVGQSPHVDFQCATSEETLARIAAGPAPLAGKHARRVAKGLEAICAKAMAHAPADRYANTAEFTADIERWLVREPVSARAEPWTKRALRWSLKHRTQTIAIFMFVMFVTVVGTGRSILLWKERELQELNEFNNLAGQARFSEIAVAGLIGRLQDQLRFFGLSRAVHDLATTWSEGKPDQLKAARQTVVDLFVELMREEPNVSELMIVHKDGPQADIVRVHRDAKSLEPKLLDAGDPVGRNIDPAIELALQLKPGKITLSRAIRPKAPGAAAEPKSVVLAGAMPIYVHGELFGVVSVELDFGSFLVRLFEDTQEPDRLVCIANDLGQMLLDSRPGESPQLTDEENPLALSIPIELKDFLAHPDRKAPNIVRTLDGELAYCSRIHFDPLPPRHFISLAVGRRPESIETAPVRLQRQAQILFGVSFLVAALTFSLALGGLWRLARGLD